MQSTRTSGARHEKVLPSILKVAMGAAPRWLAHGWSDCMRMRAPLAVLTVTLLGVALFSSTLGLFLIPAGSIVYLGVVAGYCQMLDKGEQVPYGDVQAFRNASLWFLAILAGAAVVLLRLLAGELADSGGGPALSFLGIAILALPACIALCVAPALVVAKDVDALHAVRLGLLGSLKNPVPVLSFIFLAGALLGLASLPLGAGLVVALPVVACGCHAICKDMFN